MIRFSIVTVTLNCEQFINEALISVTQQTFREFEHIVWDGKSEDNTLEIVQQFPHVKVFSGKDTGISDAMNRGLQLAQGEYILFLHGDDGLAHERVLEEIDDFLTQKGNPAWVYGRADVIDKDGQYVRTTPLVSFDAKRLRKYNIITHPATVVSRKLLLDKGGFRTDLRYCMDYELWLRLAQTHVALPMPIVVARFREHMGSLSTRESQGVANEAYRVRNEYVKNIWERFRSYRTWKRRCRKINKSGTSI